MDKINFMENDDRLKKAIEVYSSPYYNAYCEIITKTSQLLKEIDIDDPFRASLVFEYLLWNGYFSKDNSLQYSYADRILNTYVMGADIMTGRSVCLNNSDMLTRVLEQAGYSSIILIGYMNEKQKIASDYSFKVNIKVSSQPPQYKKLLDKIKSYYFGNHAISAFSYNNSIYYIDSTNCVFLEPVGFNRLSPFKSKNKFIINKSSSVIINPNDLKQTYSSFFSQNSNQGKLDPSFVSDINSEVLDLCSSSTRLFEEFHESIESQIDSVCKTLKR